jgi:hypothetical protein
MLVTAGYVTGAHASVTQCWYSHLIRDSAVYWSRCWEVGHQVSGTSSIPIWWRNMYLLQSNFDFTISEFIVFMNFTLFAWFQPNAHNINVRLLLIFPEFVLDFSSPGYENLLNFTFLVQFSQFLIWDNRPPSLLAVALSLVWKFESSGWCTAASVECKHHVTSLQPSMHEQIFLLPWSKQLVCARPDLNLMHLGVAKTQWVYFVSPISDKCTKEWPLQHSDHSCFHKWNI